MTWKTNEYWQNQGKTSQVNGIQVNSPDLLLDRYLVIRCVYWSNEVWSTEYIVAKFIVAIFWTIHLNTALGWLKILSKYIFWNYFPFSLHMWTLYVHIEHRWLKTKHGFTSKLTANALHNACLLKFRSYDIFDMPPIQLTKQKHKIDVKNWWKATALRMDSHLIYDFIRFAPFRFSAYGKHC